MAKKCPACGTEMVDSTAPFDVNGIEVVGIAHKLCPECGEMTVNARQMDELHGYLLAKKETISVHTSESAGNAGTSAIDVANDFMEEYSDAFNELAK